MTRLVRVHLGTAPGQGKQSFDQCVAFKRQLRSALPSADGAWLLTVSDSGRMAVEAVCDAETPGGEAWGNRAAELAAEVWGALAARRMGRTR